MRVLLSSSLIFLIASGASFGQVPTDWDQWVADGLTAEDNSEYKDAEKLFTQACDFALIDDLGSERLTRACLLLSRLYSIQNELKKADKVAEALVTALDAYAGSRLVDRVRALTEAASIRAAQADFDRTDEYLRAAMRLAAGLEPYQRAVAYADFAAFLLPADLEPLGADFLRAAMTNLVQHPDWSNVAFVNAAVTVGHALFWAERRLDTLDLLAPAIHAARLRAPGAAEFDELWQAYSDASGLYLSVLRSRGDGESADRLAEERLAWPRATGTALQGDGVVQSPSLRRGVEPSSTPGSDLKKVEGTVALSIEVWPDGRAHNIKVVRPLPYGLSWSAIGAIRKWRFQPGTKGGEPTKVSAEVFVRFRQQ